MFLTDQEEHARRQLPLFFIHVVENEGITVDEEGSHLVDLAAAHVEAVDGARQMLSEAVLCGEPLRLDRVMRITDKDGKILWNLSFRDVLSGL